MNQPTLGSLWESTFTSYQNETAIVFGERRLTFGQLRERARQLAEALMELGAKPQDRVAMLSTNSDHYIEYYTACEMSGFIASTINFRLAAPEMQYIVNDATPKILIFESQYTSLIGSIRNDIQSVDEFICIGNRNEVPAWARDFNALPASDNREGSAPPPRAEDIAHLIYTSGTTGRPKGCMLGQTENVSLARGIAELLQMSPSSSTLLVMPLFHVGAKALQLGQHRAGGAIHILQSFDEVSIFKTVQKERITHLHLAPTMIQSLIEHPDFAKYDLSSVRCICYSAAPMPEPVLRRGLELLGPVFVQFWGQTETVGTVLPAAFHRPNGNEADKRRLVSIGHAWPETEMRIVDDDGKDLPQGMPGQMLVRGPVMMRGYWNNSAATLEALRDGWLHTGDICTRDEEGFLYLVDRKKDMIVSGGENIYSREVEEALLKLNEVAECAVIGVPHQRWGETVCAVIVRRPGSMVSEEDIVSHCRTQIAAYKRPRYVVFTDELPKLPSGKISKIELRKLYGVPGALKEIQG